MAACPAVSPPRILLQRPVSTSTVSPARLIYCRHKKPCRRQVFYLTLKQSEKRCSLTRARGNTIGGANKRRVRRSFIYTSARWMWRNRKRSCETTQKTLVSQLWHCQVSLGGVSPHPHVTTTGTSSKAHVLLEQLTWPSPIH